MSVELKKVLNYNHRQNFLEKLLHNNIDYSTVHFISSQDNKVSFFDPLHSSKINKDKIIASSYNCTLPIDKKYMASLISRFNELNNDILNNPAKYLEYINKSHILNTNNDEILVDGELVEDKLINKLSKTLNEIIEEYGKENQSNYIKNIKDLRDKLETILLRNIYSLCSKNVDCSDTDLIFFNNLDNNDEELKQDLAYIFGKHFISYSKYGKDTIGNENGLNEEEKKKIKEYFSEYLDSPNYNVMNHAKYIIAQCSSDSIGVGYKTISLAKEDDGSPTNISYYEDENGMISNVAINSKSYSLTENINTYSLEEQKSENYSLITYIPKNFKDINNSQDYKIQFLKNVRNYHYSNIKDDENQSNDYNIIMLPNNEMYIIDNTKKEIYFKDKTVNREKYYKVVLDKNIKDRIFENTNNFVDFLAVENEILRDKIELDEYNKRDSFISRISANNKDGYISKIKYDYISDQTSIPREAKTMINNFQNNDHLLDLKDIIINFFFNKRNYNYITSPENLKPTDPSKIINDKKYFDDYLNIFYDKLNKLDWKFDNKKEIGNLTIERKTNMTEEFVKYDITYTDKANKKHHTFLTNSTLLEPDTNEEISYNENRLIKTDLVRRSNKGKIMIEPENLFKEQLENFIKLSKDIDETIKFRDNNLKVQTQKAMLNKEKYDVITLDIRDGLDSSTVTEEENPSKLSSILNTRNTLTLKDDNENEDISDTMIVLGDDDQFNSGISLNNDRSSYYNFKKKNRNIIEVHCIKDIDGRKDDTTFEIYYDKKNNQPPKYECKTKEQAIECERFRNIIKNRKISFYIPVNEKVNTTFCMI